MRVAFVTLWDGPDYDEMESLVEHNKRRYCSKHGFDYIVFDSSLDRTRHTYWSKIKAVQKVLGGYDWVIWHDTDAVVWNDQVDLRPLMACQQTDFIIQDDRNGLNAGIFLIRNCEWSARFLTTVYDQTHLLNHPCPEQQAIADLIRTTPWRERSHVLRHQEPHFRMHGLFAYAEWDKLFVHFAGIGNDIRLPLIENITRLAGYEKHLRVLSRDDFPELLTRLGLLGQGALVGAGDGTYASALLECWRGKTLHLLAPWTNEECENPITTGFDQRRREGYRDCIWRTSRWRDRAILHEPHAADAAEAFGAATLDFVRLDSDPSYAATSRAIRRWWPKIKPGGLLIGNNYRDGVLAEGDFGIRSAVREFEQQTHVAAAVTLDWNWASWYVIKPSQTTPPAWHCGHPIACSF